MATIPCASCGCQEHAELIDTKSSDDHTRLLCVGCYGPGWSPLSDRSLDKSVCDHLGPLYDAWLERQQIQRVAAGALNTHGFTPKHIPTRFHPNPVSLCA